MPRLVHKVPRYTKHVSGRARVRYNGKTVYLGEYGSPESHEAYAQFIASIPKPEDEGKPPEPAPGAVLMVGEIILHYLAHAKSYYVHADGTPTGEHETIRAVLRPLRKLFATLPAREFGPKKLKQVQQAMVELDWSRRYINKATGIIKRMFAWCASEELIPADASNSLIPVKGLKKGRTAAREKPPIGVVADEVVEATLPHVSELTQDIISVMRLTGARPGEVLAMVAAGIDKTDPSCWVYRPSHHKTAHHGQSRAIFIGPRAQEIILPRIMRAGDDSKLFPMRRTTLWSLVHRGCQKAFPHPALSSIAAKELTEVQKAELKAWDKAHRWHPNQLRHNRGTEVRTQFGLEHAQITLGHSKADTTQIYAERDLEKGKAVARKIG
jgi:integrase